ncbi:MAG: hypothetical protein ABJA74_00495 [Lapillicoccus sp.]
MVLGSVPGGYAALLDTWDGRNFLAIASDGYPSDPARDANGTITDPRWAFFPLLPYLLRAAGAVTGLPVEVLVPALNGMAALAAMAVLYVATRRFTSRSVATAVVTLVATSMAMPVWTLAYSDTMALLGVIVVLALLAARRYGWLAASVAVLAVTRPVMAPLAIVLVLDMAYFWRRFASNRHRTVALATTVWAGMSVLIWPIVAWAATDNPMTYWDTEKAYEIAGKPRSWLVWALQCGLGGVLAIVLVGAVLLWVAVRAIPTDAPFGWRVWLIAYPVYLGGATFVSGSLVRYLLLLFPAALLLAGLARSRWGRAFLAGCCALGLALQAAWVVLFAVPAGGLIP